MSEQPDRKEAFRPESDPAGDQRWWRTVLGEYPTGVTLITSVDAEGEPVAMVVGSFSAVSESPPLVSFMPTTNSSTFPAIAANGRFIANVLGASHEQLCRAFSRKTPERFSEGKWVESGSGIPRLADAVAWFDGTIVDQHPAGDHTIVVASINEFGVGGTNSGLPLLYLRGGYGSFTVPSLEFDVHGFARQLKLVDVIRQPIVDLAEELDVECVICGLAGDSVVVLNAMNQRGGFVPGSRPVGASFPFAAPVAPTFAAWGGPEVVKTWIENARHHYGSVDRVTLQTLLERTRERGYGIWRGSQMGDELARISAEQSTQRIDLSSLWESVARESELADATALPDDASSVQLPLFAPNGSVELVVVISSFQEAIATIGGERLMDRMLTLRSNLSALLADAELT